MADTTGYGYSRTIQPLHAVLLAGSVPLFLGAALCDVAYASTYQIQWSNFASWLLVGALVFAGIAFLFAIVDLFRAHRRAQGLVPYVVLLLGAWLVGFFDALIHAKDAWAGMPTGLVLSWVATALACAATWLGFRTPRDRRPV